jgi:hypothetical protein
MAAASSSIVRCRAVTWRSRSGGPSGGSRKTEHVGSAHEAGPRAGRPGLPSLLHFCKDVSRLVANSKVPGQHRFSRPLVTAQCLRFPAASGTVRHFVRSAQRSRRSPGRKQWSAVVVRFSTLGSR